MVNDQKLINLSEQLQQYVKKCDELLAHVKETADAKYDFYNEVKPFADEVKQIADEWKVLALAWIDKEHPKQIHPPQILSACENFEQLSIQAFFNETNVKRFKEMYYAAQFLLENMLQKLVK